MTKFKLFSEVAAMKRLLGLLMFAYISVSMSFAGYSDGWITAEEYEGHVSWTNSNQSLIVDGGGAIGIEMRNHSQLEVRSTSSPLGLGSGIQVIGLNDYSHLDYRNGETFNLMLYGNATADLYGGRIDYLTSFQYAATTLCPDGHGFPMIRCSVFKVNGGTVRHLISSSTIRNIGAMIPYG